MNRTIETLRRVVNDGGPAAIGDAWQALAEHDADPIGAAARDLLAAIASHRLEYSSSKRRTIDRIAGNVRKLENMK